MLWRHCGSYIRGGSVAIQSFRRRYFTVYCSKERLVYLLMKANGEIKATGELPYSLESIQTLKNIYPKAQQTRIILDPSYYQISHFSKNLASDIHDRKLLKAMIAKDSVWPEENILIDSCELDNGDFLIYSFNKEVVQQFYHDFYRVYAKSISIYPVERFITREFEQQLQASTAFLIYNAGQRISVLVVADNNIVDHCYLPLPPNVSSLSALVQSDINEDMLLASWLNEIGRVLERQHIDLPDDTIIISEPIESIADFFQRNQIGQSVGIHQFATNHESWTPQINPQLIFLHSGQEP